MRITHEALTFDDVMLRPAYSEILPREVDLVTRLTRSLTLNIPLVSAAMDSVTEARLAITLAQEGGIGIIHKNMAPEEQARQVARVKKFESGVISDPITVAPTATIRRLNAAIAAAVILGFAEMDVDWTRQTRAEIQELVDSTDLGTDMKAFGYWEGWESGERGRRD